MEILVILAVLGAIVMIPFIIRMLVVALGMLTIGLIFLLTLLDELMDDLILHAHEYIKKLFSRE